MSSDQERKARGIVQHFRRQTINLKTADEWMAWSQAVPDDEVHLAYVVFMGAMSNYDQHPVMLTEMGRLFAEAMRAARSQSDASEFLNKAQASLAKAHALEPGYVVNLIEAIRLFRDLQQFEMAESIYSMLFLAKRLPNGDTELNAYHCENLGDIYEGLRRSELARACYGKALEIYEHDDYGRRSLLDKLTLMEERTGIAYNPEDWKTILTRMDRLQQHLPVENQAAPAPG